MNKQEQSIVRLHDQLTNLRAKVANTYVAANPIGVRSVKEKIEIVQRDVDRAASADDSWEQAQALRSAEEQTQAVIRLFDRVVAIGNSIH